MARIEERQSSSSGVPKAKPWEPPAQPREGPTKPRETARQEESEFKPEWRFQQPVAWRDTDIDEKTLKEWFYYMLLGRQIDYRFQVLNRQGRAPSSSRAPAMRPRRSGSAGR